MNNRITFKNVKTNTIQVFRFDLTTNLKISDGCEMIMQTYVFSKAQFNYVKNSILNNKKRSMSAFFALDNDNCLDCPYSGNSGNGKCYTHKYKQYGGFIIMLKSLINQFNDFDNIPNFSKDIEDKIIKLSKNRYIRFGTYGEPTLHPISLIEKMVKVSRIYTGYTHQYANNEDFNKWFMASTHSENESIIAQNKYGFRSYLCVPENNGIKAIICPASNESKINNEDINCSICGLCSGVEGKTNKNIVILEH